MRCRPGTSANFPVSNLSSRYRPLGTVPCKALLLCSRPRNADRASPGLVRYQRPIRHSSRTRQTVPLQMDQSCTNQAGTPELHPTFPKRLRRPPSWVTDRHSGTSRKSRSCLMCKSSFGGMLRNRTSPPFEGQKFSKLLRAPAHEHSIISWRSQQESNLSPLRERRAFQARFAPCDLDSVFYFGATGGT